MALSNKQLRQERQQEQEEERKKNQPYANQLYGTGGSAAEVSGSPMGTQNDIGDYYNKQNQDMADGKIGMPTNQLNNSNMRGALGGNAAALKGAMPNATQPTNQPATQPTAGGAPKAGSPTAGLTGGGGNTPTAPAGWVTNPDGGGSIDGYNFSRYDMGLDEGVRGDLLAAKKKYRQARQTGNDALAKEAHLEAQYLRAINGGYIDPVGDGSGYTPLGYATLHAADKELPQDVQNQIIKLQIGYKFADDDAERDYYHQKANELRNQYGNYTLDLNGNYVPYNPATTPPSVDQNKQDKIDSAFDDVKDKINGGTTGTDTTGGNGGSNTPTSVNGIDLGGFIQPIQLPDRVYPDKKDYIADTSFIDAIGRNTVNRDDYSYDPALEEKAKAYENQYAGIADELKQARQNGSTVPDWNPETDPVYQAYSNLYDAQAKANAQNALAQAAGNTGGIGNSAALTIAGQQRQAALLDKQRAYADLAELYYNRMNNNRDYELRNMQTGADIYGALSNRANQNLEAARERTEQQYQFDTNRNEEQYQYDKNMANDLAKWVNDLGYRYYETDTQNAINDYWKTVETTVGYNKDTRDFLYKLLYENRGFDEEKRQNDISNELQLVNLMLNDSQFQQEQKTQIFNIMYGAAQNAEQERLQREFEKEITLAKQQWESTENQLERDFITWKLGIEMGFINPWA